MIVKKNDPKQRTLDDIIKQVAAAEFPSETLGKWRDYQANMLPRKPGIQTSKNYGHSGVLDLAVTYRGKEPKKYYTPHSSLVEAVAVKEEEVINTFEDKYWVELFTADGRRMYVGVNEEGEQLLPIIGPKPKKGARFTSIIDVGKIYLVSLNIKLDPKSKLYHFDPEEVEIPPEEELAQRIAQKTRMRMRTKDGNLIKMLYPESISQLYKPKNSSIAGR